MIPTYIVSEISPFIKRGGGPHVISNNNNIVVKDDSRVYFYNNEDFSLEHKFKILDGEFSNFKLRDAIFVNVEGFKPWLNERFWCKHNNSFTIFDKSGILQSFGEVDDYQFSNEHIVTLKDGLLEIFDEGFNKITETDNVLEGGFIFDGDKLFVLKGNEEYPTRVLYKYNFPNLQTDVSRFISSDEQWKIVGLDDNYVYTGVDDIEVYKRYDFNHHTTIKKKEMQMDNRNLLVYSPNTRYSSKTTYILQDTPFFDVGVYPVHEEV